MRHITIVSFVVAAILCSCNGTADHTESVIGLDIRKALSQEEKDHFLSDLTDKINYIPLETNEACLLTMVHDMFLYQDYIFISDFKGLFQFDVSGRFVRQIGRAGKGPGEHGQMIRFTVDTVQNEILLLSSGKMNVYDLETGAYKRRFDVHFDVSKFAVFSKGYIVFFTNELPQEFLASTINEIYITDSNGQIVDSVPNYNRLNYKSGVGGYANLYSISHDELRFIYNFRDTLFVFDESLTKRPHIALALDNKVDPNNLVIEAVSGVQLPDFVWIFNFLENHDYIFITTQNGIGGAERYLNNILSDKKAKVLTKSGEFINDIDGGMPFWPKFSAGNTLIAHSQPYEIIDHYKSTIGTIDHGESFIHLVNNLDEADNPVLILLQSHALLKNTYLQQTQID